MSDVNCWKEKAECDKGVLLPDLISVYNTMILKVLKDTAGFINEIGNLNNICYADDTIDGRFIWQSYKIRKTKETERIHHWLWEDRMQGC